MTTEFADIHEVQAGELENRDDDDAIAEFNRVYERWHEGDLDLRMPGGESGRDVLDRYLPVVTDLRLRYLDDHEWTEDIVLVSHGAAIRLVSAQLAGVDNSFVLDHHLANTDAVMLAPITDGRWSCVHWGSRTPPFYPEPDVHPVEDALNAADPMGCPSDRSGSDGGSQNVVVAFASRRVAIDDQGMQNQIWIRTSSLGTFRPLPRMADERAVAVLVSLATFSAIAHGSVVTPLCRIAGQPRGVTSPMFADRESRVHLLHPWDKLETRSPQGMLESAGPTSDNPLFRPTE